MPDFRAACAYAASQGWLIVRGDVLTLTTGGMAAASTRERWGRALQSREVSYFGIK
jgi:hypothetical protein